jgi:hypothetical protein
VVRKIPYGSPRLADTQVLANFDDVESGCLQQPGDRTGISGWIGKLGNVPIFRVTKD